MAEIISSLTALGYRPLKGALDKPLNCIELDDQIKSALPDDYCAFLSAFPETGVFDKQIVFSALEKSPWAADGKEVLEVLYASCSDKNNDLLTLRTQYAEQLPAHFFVIGQVTGANLVCIDLRNESRGKVYVWDHEHIDDAHGGLYWVANDFSAFVDLLHVSEQATTIASPKLVRMELSDVLKARVAELMKNKK
ncbi:SMI1/KNR4 family protein [Chromobacterium alticapitis]|uniref:SMI1/KNR4 family protein n=1 Tax=Chromobacterium alticapitis TaxID=2073169 RepID=UPI001304A672|nr:SMI1/KNR4 family protein [Chromobacterium alticapitis]